MKRILFIPGNCVPFHGNSLEQRPLGGTETGVIRVSKALQTFDIDAIVASGYQNPPLTDPLFIPMSAIPLAGEFDAVIGIRDWQTLLGDIKAKKRFLWTGDAFDQPATVGLGDKRVTQLIDGLLCVSEWQKQTMCNTSGFPIEKSFVIQNGIDQESFVAHSRVPRDRHRMIYSSTPYRGLVHLLKIFPNIKSAVPSASLVICSGYDVYQGNSPTPAAEIQKYEAMIDTFLEMDGVIVRGNIPQKELAYEMMRSSVLAYPNTFAETSCITALEAKAAGAVVVSSRLGALPQTVGKGGVLLDGDPTSEAYQEEFTKECIKLLTDDQYWLSYSEVALQEVKEQTWVNVAQRIASLLQ